MNLSIFDAAREHPHRVAVVAEGVPYTFAELAARVRRAIDEGRTEDPALVATPSLVALETLYARLAQRRRVVLLHPRWTEGECERALASLGESFDNRSPGADDRSSRAPPLHSSRAQSREESTDQIGAVVFTGGTTGSPKGVALSLDALEAAAVASAERLGWKEGDRWLLCIPFAHVGGLSILTRCLHARRTVVLARSSAFSPEETLELVQREGATLLSIVPTQLRRMLDCSSPPLSPRLRAILVGGGPASPSMLSEAADRGWPVLTTYGLTEACSQVATQRPGTVNRGQLGSGEALDGTEIRIAGGVIEVRSSTLMDGYCAGPEMGWQIRRSSREQFRSSREFRSSRSQFSSSRAQSRDGFFRTGDAGFIDEARNLHVLGRTDDVIITGGEKVHPVEVEQALESFPSVKTACVFGVADDHWGQVVAAALTLRRGELDSHALGQHVAGMLGSYKRPRKFAVVSAIPQTANGKADRRQLAADVVKRLHALP